MSTQDPGVPGRPEGEPESTPGRPEGEPESTPGFASGDLPPAPPPPPPPAPPPPAPPPPPPGPRHGAEARNGLGTAGLVCGVVAVVLSLIPGVNVFTWPLGVLAIVFGAIGWGRANKGGATNRGAAITGLVLGIASFFTFCLIYVIIGASSSVYYDASGLF